MPICPICNGRCHHHAWYDRKVREPNIVIIPILRVKCVGCGRTHAILPDFLFPKGRYTEPIREEVIKTREHDKKTQEELSEAQSVKTTKRWINRYHQQIERVIAALQSILARLGMYIPFIRGNPLDRLRQICEAIEAAIGRKMKAVGDFGKANILLSWGAPGVWI